MVAVGDRQVQRLGSEVDRNDRHNVGDGETSACNERYFRQTGLKIGIEVGNLLTAALNERRNCA